MKMKKRVAGLLAATMMLTQVSLFGYVQKPLDQQAIRAITVSHTDPENLVLTTDIKPNVTVEFDAAPENTTEDPGHLDDVPGGHNKANRYKISLTDAVDNKVIAGTIDTARYQPTATGRYVVDLQNIEGLTTKLRNGALYKLQIFPGHTYNVYNNAGAVIDVKEIFAVTSPYEYILTDLNPVGEQVGDSIELKWEYIPGATYTLNYAQEDLKNKGEFTNNNNVNVFTKILQADDMKIVTEKGIKKVVYNIDDIEAGKIYSAYVQVTDVNSSFLSVDFANKVYKNTENPKVVHVSTKVNLTVEYIGNKRIKLSWKLGDWMNSLLSHATIYEKKKGQSEENRIGTINNPQHLTGSMPCEFEYDEPSQISYYRIVFHMKEGHKNLETNVVEYIPYELLTKPLKPQVPLPYSTSINVTSESQKLDYVVTGDDVSISEMLKNTFHVTNKKPISVQLVWDAQKKPEKIDEVDYDLTYDIWVVGDSAQLNDVTLQPVIEDLQIKENDMKALIMKQDGESVIGFKTALTKYTNAMGAVVPMTSNKTYYIKIVAKRHYTNSSISSEATITTITIDKYGEISTPPVLAKPPLQVLPETVTDTEATIAWLDEWYEILAKQRDGYTDPDEKHIAEFWNSAVYLGGTPAIKFASGEGLTKYVLKTQQILNTVISKVGETEFNENYASRKVELGSDVKYEMKTLSYDEVITKISGVNTNTSTAESIKLESWIADNEKDTTEGWQGVTPVTKNHLDDFLDWKEYTLQGLKPNTRYIVLVRAYRITEEGEKLIQTFPSYVILTTKSDYISEEPAPTVPILNPNGVTESSVSVYWVYNKDFDYEVVYGRLDDPNKATSWPVVISNVEGDKDYVADGGKVVVTITGLAADTSYNVWVRAKQKIGTGVSSWSNPVTQKTSAIGTPSVPKGLGKASYQSIVEAGQDFPVVGADYITVEWSRIPADDEKEPLENRVYTYVLEFADNVEFMDAVSVDVSSNSAQNATVLSKTLVKCAGFSANKPYYFRVKTVMTYTNPETKVVVTKESAFCSTVRIYTTTSSGEYDGGENENVVTFDKPIDEYFNNGIWTYEILDVAQVTSEMLNKKQYYYTITMEHYNNKYDANTRRIKMPKTVLDTVIKNGMALKIVTNRGIYDIPGKALRNQSSKYSAKDTVQFDLTRMDYSDIVGYIRTYPETYQTGEKLDVRIKGKAINKFDDLISISLRLGLTGAYNFSNFTTYQYNYGVGNWQAYQYTVDNKNNAYLTFKTINPGLNAIYERSVQKGNTGSSYTMNQIASKYNVKGLGTSFFKKDNVNAAQYVSLLIGISTKKDAIDMTAAPTADDYSKAKKAGIYISSSKGALTKEQALAGIVKLYELNTGVHVKPSNVKINGTSAAYKDAVGKAYAIGLIDDLKPQQKITYEELCDWLVQVVE